MLRSALRLSLALTATAALFLACDPVDEDLCDGVTCLQGSCNADTGACDCDEEWSGESCEVQDPIEIVGTYVDDYQMDHTITQATWVTMGSTFHISQYSNAGDWAVALNDADNAYNPDLWSRFDWTYSGSDLYYCQSAFDAADEDAALAVTPADAADLSTGCGGFAWSMLTPQ